MTDTWPPEVELDELDREIGDLERRVDRLERAPFEGRMGDPIVWDDQRWNLTRRLSAARLERATLASVVEGHKVLP